MKVLPSTFVSSLPVHLTSLTAGISRLYLSNSDTSCSSMLSSVSVLTFHAAKGVLVLGESTPLVSMLASKFRLSLTSVILPLLEASCVLPVVLSTLIMINT